MLKLNQVVHLSSCLESAVDGAELVRCSMGAFVFWFLPSVALTLLNNEKSSWFFFSRVNSREIPLGCDYGSFRFMS